ncbi:MAG: Ig-like domain-containing protein, partial [Bacilli bacterium]|nr:Ig-like domain-containing protein [Bacilli bacterium]
DPEFVEIDDLYVISVFDSIPLHYEAYPSGAKDDFVWSSSYETVATINQNGIITPVSEGYVEINIEFFGFEHISDNIGLDIVTPDLIVNPTWTSYSQSQDVIYEGVTYSFGVTAFNSLNSALALAGMDDYIYLCDGSYTENVVISINNINIITSNSGVNPNYNMSDRSSGAIFTNKITIGSGASNILLSGLDFTANGQVVSGGTAVDTVMMNFCNYYDSSIPVGDNGLVYFKELGNTALADPNTEQHYNFKFYYNRFVTPTSARLINFGRIENLEIVGNYFEGNNLSYADGVRTNYLAGDSTIIVANNTFTKISQYSLFVYKENTALDIRIINNKFYDSVCDGAIDLRNYLGTDGYIEIAYNTFESITGTAIRINHETLTSLIMNVNNNIFKEIGGKYLNNTLVGNNVGFEDNFYGDVNGAPITIDPLNIVGASIYEPYYTDINDMPKYVPEGVK